MRLPTGAMPTGTMATSAVELNGESFFSYAFTLEFIVGSITATCGVVSLASLAAFAWRVHRLFEFSEEISGTQECAEIVPVPLNQLGETISRINAHLLDEQILEAGELLMRVQKTIRQHPNATEAADAKQVLQKPLLGRLSEAELLRRYAECTQAVRDLAVSEGWVRVLETETSVTSTRKLADGTAWLQSTNRVHAGLSELLATWKEGDLFVHWLPDCIDSKVLVQITPVESLCWWRTRTKAGLELDASMHCYPCDAFPRHGFALMIGRPAPPEQWPAISWPELGRWRMRAPALAMSIKIEQVGREVQSCFVLGPMAAGLLRVPNFIVQWVLKNSLSLILEGQAKCAIDAREHPDGHPLAERIKQRADFYRDWLLPRLPKSAE